MPKTETESRTHSPSMRVALVVEGGRCHTDHQAFTALAKELSYAQAHVQLFHHGLGRLAKLHLRRQVASFAPDVLLATGIASILDLQKLADRLGAQLIACYWPRGNIVKPRAEKGPAKRRNAGYSHAILGVGCHSAAELGGFPNERIHTFAVAHEEPPSEATLRELVTLLFEIRAQKKTPTLRSKWSRAVGILPVFKRQKELSLAYHRVVLKLRGPDPQLMVSATVFERQIRALLRRGYRPLTQADQVREGKVSTTAKEPSFAVTFDDGYLDTLEVAAPILHSLGVPFTVYVITQVVEQKLSLPWYEWFLQALTDRDLSAPALALIRRSAALQRLVLIGTEPPFLHLPQLMAGLKKLAPTEREDLTSRLSEQYGQQILASPRTPKYLNREQVLQLRDLGAEISSHTCTHPILPTLSDTALEAELVESRKYIQGLCGVCPGLCYPNGDTDSRVAAMAQAAGYEYAVCVTPQPGKRDPFRLGRQMVSEDFASLPAGLPGWPLDEKRFVAKLFLGVRQGPSSNVFLRLQMSLRSK